MNSQFNDEDPELRRLLDSMGVVPNRMAEDLDPAEKARAEQMLAQILASRRAGSNVSAPSPSRRLLTGRRVAIAGLLSLFMGLALVVTPWNGGKPAAADTPPLLNFSLVDEGHYPATGRPARHVLKALERRAMGQSHPGNRPVQHIELEGWWASSNPADQKESARTAIIPVHSTIFVLANGDRRAIERHDKPLDQHGRLVSSPNQEKAFSDVTTSLDPERGPDFPLTLPADLAHLRSALAPKDGCAKNAGGCLLKQISELYNNYVVDPGLAARLWQVLRNEPTVTTLGTGVDRLGRKVVALTAPNVTPSEQLIILVDQKTGEFRGSELILIKRDHAYGIKPPAVIQFTALLSSRRVADSDVPDDRHSVRY